MWGDGMRLRVGKSRKWNRRRNKAYDRVIGEIMPYLNTYTHDRSRLTFYAGAAIYKIRMGITLDEAIDTCIELVQMMGSDFQRHLDDWDD